VHCSHKAESHSRSQDSSDSTLSAESNDRIADTERTTDEKSRSDWAELAVPVPIWRALSDPANGR